MTIEKHEVLLRMRAIELLAYWEGRLVTNRLVGWFGVSRQQASADIKRYMEQEGRHPLAHLITNIHTLEGDGGVELRSRGIFPIAGKNSRPGHRVFYGSYYDKVVMTNGGWRVNHRVFSTARKP